MKTKSMFNRIYRHFVPQMDPNLVKKKYGIPENLKLEISFKDGWFIATSPELPGLRQSAKTGEELLNMVNDAILCYFDVPEKESDYVFDNIKIDGKGEFSYKNKKVLQTA